MLLVAAGVTVGVPARRLLRIIIVFHSLLPAKATFKFCRFYRPLIMAIYDRSSSPVECILSTAPVACGSHAFIRFAETPIDHADS